MEEYVSTDIGGNSIEKTSQMNQEMNKFMDQAKDFLALRRSGDGAEHLKTLETVKHSAGASKEAV